MSVSMQEDFKGRIAKRIKLANERELTINNMISIISEGEEGIEKHFKEKMNKSVEEHKSMLSEFQL